MNCLFPESRGFVDKFLKISVGGVCFSHMPLVVDRSL